MIFNFLVLVISVFYKLSFYGFLHQVNHRDLQPAILVTASNISKNTFNISKPLKSIKKTLLKTRLLKRNNIRQGYNNNIANRDINPNYVVVNEVSINKDSEAKIAVTSSNVVDHYYRIESSSSSSYKKPLVISNLRTSLSEGNIKNLEQIDSDFISLNRHTINSARSSTTSINSIRSNNLSYSEQSITLNTSNNLRPSVGFIGPTFDNIDFLSNQFSMSQKKAFGFTHSLMKSGSYDSLQWVGLNFPLSLSRVSSGVTLVSGTLYPSLF